MHKLESVPENKTPKILWDFEINTDHQTLAGKPDLVLINKKKRTCHLVDFFIQVDHWVKMKESKKIDKFLDLARELKNLWNIRVMVIPIVVGTLGMVPKGLELRLGELEMRGRIETIQPTALLSPGDLKRPAVTLIPVKTTILNWFEKLARSEIIINFLKLKKTSNSSSSNDKNQET